MIVSLTPHLSRNPAYTGSYSTSGTCTWTLAKCSQDVCLIRRGGAGRQRVEGVYNCFPSD